MISSKTGKLNRANRINKAADYRQIFKSSCRSIDKEFLVIAKDNRQQLARLGLSIPKKNIKQAVVRNRIKRTIRESFRCHQDMLMGLDIVVVAYSGQCDKTNKRKITDSLNKHWQYISRCRKS